MNFLTDALHPRKYHLYQLPELPEGQFPEVQGQSRDAVVLLPVFGAENNTAIEDYVTKAAAWALRTWFDNSDAINADIPCYIYVESASADRILPILEANNVPERFICVADYRHTKEYGKSLAPLFDNAFSGYRYLVISDVDLFVMATDGQKLPLFKAIHNTKPHGIGVADAWQMQAPLIDSGANYWIDRVYYARGAKEWIPTRQMFPKWLEIVQALTDKPTANVFKSGWFLMPFASTWLIRNDVSAADKEWLLEACDRLGDDEAVISVYAAWRNEKIWTLKDLSPVIPHYEINEPEFITRFTPYGLKTEPCLMHFGNSIEHAFMKAIGCYDEHTHT